VALILATTMALIALHMHPFWAYLDSCVPVPDLLSACSPDPVTPPTFPARPFPRSLALWL
jgi:hypothetical protein